MPAVQKQTPFFDFTDDRSMPHLPLPPSLEETRMSLAPNNSGCPLNEIIAGSANELSGPLVRAMGMEDGYMPTRVGGEMQIVDCWEVCWIASTTDRRRLPTAFSKRLTTTIEWTPMDEETLTRIVRAGVTKTANSACGRDLTDSVCALIARYAKTPMRAVYDFTPKVFQQKRLMPSCSWAECCEIVAKDIRR
jgi:hypothetical protein